MPAFTANRGYPYAIATDPADVPSALQALAEEIDDDVCGIEANLTGRPVARFRGTGPFASASPTHPVNSPPTPYADRIPFTVTDFNTASVVLMSPDVGQRLVWPTVAGFYFVMVTVNIPPLTVAGATVGYLGLQIRRGDATNPTSLITAPRLAGLSSSINVSFDDRNMRQMTLGCGVNMNGTTDAFSVEFRADTTPDVSEYVISDRSITILKMT